MSVYLAATLAALACGPALFALARFRPSLGRGLDWAVWIGILALMGLEVMPDALGAGGMVGLLFFLSGLFLPTLLERSLRRLARETHLAALWAALLGLAIHALADGAVLAAGNGATHQEFGLAVALHSLPIGLAICWLAVPALGWPRALAVLVGVGGATVLGFALTPNLEAMLGAEAWGWFQMTVAGLLLHALTGRPHAQSRSAQASAVT